MDEEQNTGESIVEGPLPEAEEAPSQQAVDEEQRLEGFFACLLYTSDAADE